MHISRLAAIGAIVVGHGAALAQPAPPAEPAPAPGPAASTPAGAPVEGTPPTGEKKPDEELDPGDKFSAWDTQLTFDYMPSQYITFRGEFTYRHASVPYFSGAGGVTPPGGNQGAPGSQVTDMAGNVTWSPDLVKDEPRFTLALLVKL